MMWLALLPETEYFSTNVFSHRMQCSEMWHCRSFTV